MAILSSVFSIGINSLHCCHLGADRIFASLGHLASLDSRSSLHGFQVQPILLGILATQ